jgi:hypothetical protein
MAAIDTDAYQRPYEHRRRRVPVPTLKMRIVPF